MSDAVAPAARLGTLGAWSGWIFLAGVLALALGTILAIAGVNAAGLFLPGVRVLELALLLLAAGAIVRLFAPDA